MTEEEKRRKALEIFEQEEQRFQSRSSIFFSTAQANIEASLQRSARRKAVMDNLSQKGITWDQLRDAYNEEFNRGHTAMLDHHLAYFYAGIAIAFKEDDQPAPRMMLPYLSEWSTPCQWRSQTEPR